jgi:uncharacterized protein (TIGR02757 family)
MTKVSIQSILDTHYRTFNRIDFIKDDPITIPHLFNKKEDIEIAGFLIALLSWGQRITIINNGRKLMEIFDHSPHQFITQHQDSDLKKCIGFVHRTFNDTDLLSLISFLKEIYTHGQGLEKAFSRHLKKKDSSVESSLNGFRKDFENSTGFVHRTGKHIAWPGAGSACKRLNMFLRWMVRKDDSGVDFGLWTSIRPSQLVCPLDVHVIRQAIDIGLLHEPKSNWKTAIELTDKLKAFDPEDPVKYDFALFGMGVSGNSGF